MPSADTQDAGVMIVVRPTLVERERGESFSCPQCRIVYESSPILGSNTYFNLRAGTNLRSQSPPLILRFVPFESHTA